MTHVQPEVKKRKVDLQNRQFNPDWEWKYFVADVSDNVICLICKDKISGKKEYNVRRHYNSRHNDYDRMQMPEERKTKAKTLKSSLFQQQQFFTKPNLEAKAATLASISVCNIMAKRGKPYLDGEMVKEAILAAVENICPDKVSQFQSISLSRRTVTRRIE
ncbi:EPM2A-interacting protein 1-like [Watersipora subatra]|uniref:EPM2A-interacting protein 1-like n=1 Tax=Watersipora subatra TaxID=2589382 RepID=UPI00355BFE0C